VTHPPSFPPPARPDLGARLLAAVAERDQPMAERLVQQWVHRRGLQALEGLIQGPLLASQGGEAAAWLQQRAGLAASADLDPPMIGSEVGTELEPVAEFEQPLVWPQLSVVPGGAPAPAPRGLDLLRAWLPDADGGADLDGEDGDDSLPLAS
jgi:hypothetical protein